LAPNFGLGLTKMTLYSGLLIPILWNIHLKGMSAREIQDIADKAAKKNLKEDPGDMFKLLQKHLPIIPASSLKPD
jgi:hypothetical protein